MRPPTGEGEQRRRPAQGALLGFLAVDDLVVRTKVLDYDDGLAGSPPRARARRKCCASATTTRLRGAAGYLPGRVQLQGWALEMLLEGGDPARVGQQQLRASPGGAAAVDRGDVGAGVCGKRE